MWISTRFTRPGPEGARLAALLSLTMIVSQAPASDMGSLRGTINDAQDRPVAQATVQLKSKTSDWSRTVPSGQHGEFVFLTVPLGDYLLSADKTGSGTVSRSLTIGSGSSPEAHLQLLSSAALADVTVTARTDSTPSITATPTSLVSREDIERTPGASRTNSLAMITDFVPGAYVVHDQLHVRGGHQTSWAVDGVEIPNTNIASNLGPAIDPKDIDYLEVQRGSYQADQGDRTYAVFNVVPRTGSERHDEGELLVSGGSFGQTNDYLSAASHTDDVAYYVSIDGNRSGLGIETPVGRIVHDAQNGLGGFATLVYDAAPTDQIRLVFSARHDDYDIPNVPGERLDDVQRETDTFGILSWVHTLNSDATLTTSLFAHHNAADLDASPHDVPIATTDQRASTYVGGQGVLRWHIARNDVQMGVLGFGQHDSETFDILFNDGSGSPVYDRSSPSGALEAFYVEDTYQASESLTLVGGVRQTHFSGALVENATSPRLGATLCLPTIDWIVRGFWGRFYQAPPLSTLQGPLLRFAQQSNLGFLPLRGERDEEYQVGVTVPLDGWTIDVDHFRTQARNFFDHDAIGNSNAFLPLTIDGAIIRGNELSIRSPRFWTLGQAHLTYSNQVANGFGAVNGGLTDFSPPSGSFALDHDQRNTADVGVTANLPAGAFASLDVSYGSGFANGDGTPSHLPAHAEINLSLGRRLGRSWSATLTVLNLANRRLMTDNSLTFGGVHYNDPRQIIGEVHYRFGY